MGYYFCSKEKIEQFKNKVFGIFDIVSIRLYNFIIPYSSNELLKKIEEPEKMKEVEKLEKPEELRKSGRQRINKWNYTEYANPQKYNSYWR